MSRCRSVMRREQYDIATIRLVKLLLRVDFVGVIPIDGRIGSGIDFGFLAGGLVDLSLCALLFLHLTLFDALHFLLPLLECRRHQVSSTAECGAGRAGTVQPYLWQGKNYQRGSRRGRAGPRGISFAKPG